MIDGIDGSVASLLVAAGFVGALGILIKYFGQVRLIAGYDPDRVTDEEGLASFIGTNAIYVAVLTLLVAGIEYAEPVARTEPVWVAFSVGVLAFGVRMMRGARRYERPTPPDPES